MEKNFAPFSLEGANIKGILKNIENVSCALMNHCY